MVHKENLERIWSDINDRKQDLSDELKSLPEGRLHIETRKDGRFCYQLLPPEGNRKKMKRKGITRDTEKVMALIRKKYIEEAIELIDKDLSVLEIAIKHYRPFDENTVMEPFTEKYPDLAGGIYHGKMSDEEWADAFRRQEDFYAEDRKHFSINGEHMLSKNELYIAARLDHYGIPYRYEASIDHPDVNRVPDFTIRRPRDGKIIYWEHLGKTGSRGYLSGNELKFTEYEASDIAPWDNLIITYDTPDGGIDAKIIEGMIYGWLL